MARRLSREEKGKGPLHDDHGKQIKRIKAPSVDNSALIKEMSLPSLDGSITLRSKGFGHSFRRYLANGISKEEP